MELEKSIFFTFNNMDCEFRTIHEMDVNQHYVDGLKQQKEYIENISSNVSVQTQKKYIKDILSSKNNTISGLFINGKMVGTAGVQQSLSKSFLRNIDANVEKLTTIGIFIFYKKFRGIGIGKIIVWAATYLFYKCTKVEWFGAGMEIENTPSYKSFLSCGYKNVAKDSKYFKVLINIKDLKKPITINNVSIQKI
jgi:hypothetical protein